MLTLRLEVMGGPSIRKKQISSLGFTVECWAGALEGSKGGADSSAVEYF